mgnify:CR=1 FL=1
MSDKIFTDEWKCKADAEKADDLDDIGENGCNAQQGYTWAQEQVTCGQLDVHMLMSEEICESSEKDYYAQMCCTAPQECKIFCLY